MGLEVVRIAAHDFAEPCELRLDFHDCLVHIDKIDTFFRACPVFPAAFELAVWSHQARDECGVAQRSAKTHIGVLADSDVGIGYPGPAAHGFWHVGHDAHGPHETLVNRAGDADDDVAHTAVDEVDERQEV